MDYFEAVNRRRSIRKYTSQPVAPDIIEKAIDSALLAPNSSNLQTWRIFWVQSPDKKKALIEACLNQNAARSAQELLVFVADRSTWRIGQQAVLENFGRGARKEIHHYYGKLIPLTYGWLWLAPLKWLFYNCTGFFRPITRGPCSARDIDEVCIKSVALAAENFMLAISAQGFDTCPMEGLDERRVSKILGLNRCARIVMAVSVGFRDEKGVWGERFRMPRELVFKKI